MIGDGDMTALVAQLAAERDELRALLAEVMKAAPDHLPVVGLVPGTAVRFRVEAPAGYAPVWRVVRELAPLCPVVELRVLLSGLAYSTAPETGRVVALGYVMRLLRGCGVFSRADMAQRWDLVRLLMEEAEKDRAYRVVVPGGGEDGGDLVVGQARSRTWDSDEVVWWGDVTGGHGGGTTLGPESGLARLAERMAARACRVADPYEHEERAAAAAGG